MSPAGLPSGYLRLVAWVERRALEACSNPTVANEAARLTIDAFLEALGKGEIAHPASWLAVTLRNRVLLVAKRADIELMPGERLDVIADGDAAGPPLANQTDEDLDSMLAELIGNARLTDREREVVTCRWRHRSVREVAAALGRTDRDVRRALETAGSKIRFSLRRRSRPDSEPES